MSRHKKSPKHFSILTEQGINTANLLLSAVQSLGILLPIGAIRGKKPHFEMVVDGSLTGFNAPGRLMI